jgi:hypothetical protein
MMLDPDLIDLRRLTGVDPRQVFLAQMLAPFILVSIPKSLVVAKVPEFAALAFCTAEPRHFHGFAGHVEDGSAMTKQSSLRAIVCS